MKNKINNTKVSFVVGLFALAFVVLATPNFSYAETYAFVDKVGEVKTIVASGPYIAIDTAPNRVFDSGVILLKTSSDFDIVGN